MISIGKILDAEQAVRYLLKQVADQRLAYYGQGRWFGPAAAALGLAGAVDEDAFRAVLNGKHPATAANLGTHHRSRRVYAFDVTFSCPKSVSLLWALGDEATQQTVLAAIDQSLDAVCDYLQDQAGWGRRVDRVTRTVRPVRASMMMARFLHLTARPVTDPRTGATTVDPQLHVHAVIPTWVRRDDGSWGQLLSEPLYRNAASAGAIGHAVLRDDLVPPLAITPRVAGNGCFEVDGFTPTQLREFSRRTLQIEALEEALGVDSLQGHKLAVLDSRQSKGEAPVGPESFEVWRERAAAVGLDDEHMATITGRVHTAPPSRELDVPVDVLLGDEGLTAQAATFARRDLVRAVAAHVPGGLQRDELERLVDSILADTSHVVPMLPQLAEGETPAGAMARLTERAAEVRYSTPEMAAVERQMLATATAHRERRLAVADAATVAAVLQAHPEFTADQRAMVERLCLAGEGVSVVEGLAGTGKTAALGACREAWESAGYTLVGGALAAKAAEGLEEDAGVRSFTVRKLVRSLTDEDRLQPQAVLVIDEAGMVGSRDHARLVAIADRDQVKLVLVGDPAQLQPIDAGTGYRALGDRFGKIVLTQNIRQVEHWEREALQILRRGGARRAVDEYLAHDRVRTAGNARERRLQMVEDYVTTMVRTDDDVVMLAHRRDDVAKLNPLARATVDAAGGLSGPTLDVDGREFRAGDRVICLANRFRLGLKNGMRGTVIAVDPEARTLTLRTTDGRDVAIDTAVYADLDYAYALTVHKGQGMTTGTALVTASDSAGREWAYTALSRGRVKTLYYAVDHAAHRDTEGVHHWNDEAVPTVRQRIIRSWTRSDAKDSTLDYPDRYGEQLAAATVTTGEIGPPTPEQLDYIGALGGSVTGLPRTPTWVHASILIDELLGQKPGEQATVWLTDAGIDADDAEGVVADALADLGVAPAAPSAAGVAAGWDTPRTPRSVEQQDNVAAARTEVSATPSTSPRLQPPALL